MLIRSLLLLLPLAAAAPRRLSALIPLLLICQASSLVAQESAPLWRLEPALRIGSLEGEDALTQTGGVVVDEDGTMFLLQHKEAAIRVFERDGRFRTRIGRRGEGPGEFTNPTGLWLLGDTLIVSDHGLQRVTYLSKDGKVLRTLSLAHVRRRLGRGYGLLQTHRPLPDGRVVVSVETTTTRTPATQRFLMVSPDGELEETLLSAPSSTPEVLRFRRGETMIAALHPVPGGTRTAYDPLRDRVLTVSQAEVGSGGRAVVDLRVATRGGDEIVRKRLHLPARPVNRDSIMDDWVTRYSRQFGISRRAARAMVRDALRLPEFHPAFDGAGFDDEGRIRLTRTLPSDSVERLVLDESGSPVGRIVTPKGLSLILKGDHAYGTLETETGVPLLLRYRVHRR